VEGKPRTILIFETEDGRAPFSDWMDGVQGQSKLYATILNRIERVERGLLGDCKSVGQGVFELRIDFGPGYRIYFGQDGDEIVVLLAAGGKSSQEADIEKAKKYWRSYNA
jgi:putative addiction module killer protein